MAITGRRDIEIDTLRGIAIILMVAGHVIGWSAVEGMRVADDSGWRYYDLLLADLRMPLFASLSGFVYGIRPLSTRSSYGRFVRGKARRLLVPLVVVGTLFMFVQMATPDANTRVPPGEVWHVYVYGVGHFWFLQAIFLIFLLVGFLDLRGALSTAPRLASAVAISVAAAVVLSYVSTDFPGRWDLFSFFAASGLVPCFLLGYLFSKLEDGGHGRQVTAPRWWLLGVTVVLFTVNALAILDVIELSAWEDPVVGILLGVSGVATLLMFRSRLAWAPLARLGYFSFAIYLLHVFGTAPARIALEPVGVDDDVVVFVVCLAAGLALPTLFELTVGRVSWISWAFLGQKAYRRGLSPRPGDAGDQGPVVGARHGTGLGPRRGQRATDEDVIQREQGR